MPTLTAEGRKIVDDIAERHGVSADAVTTLLFALVAGQGSQAQFDHPELGGMGQWSRGGMVMVGDMFNNALKARVDALCQDLAGLLASAGTFASPRQSQSQSQGQSQGAGVSLFVPGPSGSGNWWPDELGTPGSVGSQNDLRYAFFPSTRRLAIEQGGRVTVYDTGDHQLTGFSQQQSGSQSLSFTSQHGLVRVADLPTVSAEAPPSGQSPAPSAAPGPSPAPSAAPAPPHAGSPGAPSGDDDIISKIERLADLRTRGIISDAEFQAKKSELMARL